ncbi:MAG: DUF4982 domain-containing protein [Pedobacter sp.]|nr:MAG: DUF4982 domain-containing protein [Pedobacter sp.]
MTRILNKKNLAALIAILCLSLTHAVAQVRKTESLNAGWKFYRGSLDKPWPTAETPLAEWEHVNLPHTWNAKDIAPDHARTPYRDLGQYQKKIVDFKKEAGKRYYIYFEGAGQNTDVYVNKQWIGNHKGGYTAFGFDITNALKDGENLLNCKVDNKHDKNIAPLSADFTFFGGIYRDVYLVTTEQAHFTFDNYGGKGVFIETPTTSADNASINIKSYISNDSKTTQELTVNTIVSDRNQKQILKLSKKIKLKAGEKSTIEQQSGPLANIQLWSPDQPNLYQVETQLLSKDKVIDEVSNKVGFRWFKFDAELGFYLNGKALKLMGANRHQDYPGLGNALPDEIHVADLKLLKEMGGNFIRLAHYPQDPAVLRAADELGLLIWEEIPLVNEITISKEHDDLAAENLREMIRQHYNHPSIILWGYMNEIYWKHRFIDSTLVKLHTEKTIELAKKLENIVREEDKTRYTAMAMHNYPLYEETGLGDIAMVAGWNLYHGWYYDQFEDFGKFMDEQHRLHPKRIHLISEYGAGSDPRIHTASPIRFDFSMEGQKRFSESFLKQIEERPFIAGATVWNLIDFSSEMRVDATPRMNNKGLATADRTPKDPYYLFQAALSSTPVLKIAETNYRDRTLQLEIGKNNYNQFIDVYTNLKEAELFLNGKSLGKKQSENHQITWNVAFEHSGTYWLEVKGVSKDVDVKDYLNIQVKLIPFELASLKTIDLSVNAGAHYSFFDDQSKTTWLADQPYQKGSWGYINPEEKIRLEKIISLEDISNTSLDPLFQSMRTGMKQYQFDVSDGWYEVEMRFVEPMPKMRRFADSPEPPPHPGGLRTMSISINQTQFLENTDLIKEFGYNQPLIKKTLVKVKDGKGISIDFSSKAIVSGIRIKSY